jgi:hypothetical protein
MGKTSRLRTSLSPADYRTVRHRLAYHTNAQIAEHYGWRESTVRKQISDSLQVMRERTGQPLHDAGDLLLFAERTGVTPLPLDPRATNVAQGDRQVAECEPVGVA